MSDNLMMIIRYVISTAAAYALGRGWIDASMQGALVDGLVKLVGTIAVIAPPIYAAWKIDNGKKV